VKQRGRERVKLVFFVTFRKQLGTLIKTTTRNRVRGSLPKTQNQTPTVNEYNYTRQIV